MTVRCAWCQRELEYYSAKTFARGFYHSKCLERMKRALKAEGWTEPKKGAQ